MPDILETLNKIASLMYQTGGPDQERGVTFGTAVTPTTVRFEVSDTVALAILSGVIDSTLKEMGTNDLSRVRSDHALSYIIEFRIPQGRDNEFAEKLDAFSRGLTENVKSYYLAAERLNISIRDCVSYVKGMRLKYTLVTPSDGPIRIDCELQNIPKVLAMHLAKSLKLDYDTLPAAEGGMPGNKNLSMPVTDGAWNTVIERINTYAANKGSHAEAARQ